MATNSWSRTEKVNWGPSQSVKTFVSQPSKPVNPPATVYKPHTTTPFSSTTNLKQDKLIKLKSVKLEGMALLKLIKHCNESLPELCSGSLLGLDIDQQLEVTNCFPFPNSESDLSETTQDSGYQLDMMRVLRDFSYDNNCVGWYRSTNMGSFCTLDLVEQQYTYQKQLDQNNIAKCIVLIYDPYQTRKGNLSLKAYRLKDGFIAKYEELKSGLTLSKMDNEVEDFLEEIPIELSNPAIIRLYINQIQQEIGLSKVEADRLDLSTNSFLEKSMERLLEEVDNYEQEQSRLQYTDRLRQKQIQQQQKWLQTRRLENKAREERGEPLLPEYEPSNPVFKPLPPVSRLESVLIRNQLGIYCEQMNKFAASSFPKLYVSANSHN